MPETRKWSTKHFFEVSSKFVTKCTKPLGFEVQVFWRSNSNSYVPCNYTCKDPRSFNSHTIREPALNIMNGPKLRPTSAILFYFGFGKNLPIQFLNLLIIM